MKITKQDGRYTLDVSSQEQDTIDYLQEEFPNKLERFIQNYLVERQRNREAAEDMEIVKTMSSSERESKRQEIRTAKRAARKLVRESNA